MPSETHQPTPTAKVAVLNPLLVALPLWFPTALYSIDGNWQPEEPTTIIPTTERSNVMCLQNELVTQTAQPTRVAPCSKVNHAAADGDARPHNKPECQPYPKCELGFSQSRDHSPIGYAFQVVIGPLEINHQTPDSRLQPIRNLLISQQVSETLLLLDPAQNTRLRVTCPLVAGGVCRKPMTFVADTLEPGRLRTVTVFTNQAFRNDIENPQLTSPSGGIPAHNCKPEGKHIPPLNRFHPPFATDNYEIYQGKDPLNSAYITIPPRGPQETRFDIPAAPITADYKNHVIWAPGDDPVRIQTASTKHLLDWTLQFITYTTERAPATIAADKPLPPVKTTWCQFEIQMYRATPDAPWNHRITQVAGKNCLVLPPKQ